MAAILDFKKNGIVQYQWRHKSRATLIKLQKYWLINFKTNN